MMNFTCCIPASDFGLRSKQGVLGFLPHPQIHQSSRCPSLDTLYRFDPMHWESMRQWWEKDNTKPALLFCGPADCGKSSFVREFLLRVHSPWVRVACKRSKFSQGRLFRLPADNELQRRLRLAQHVGQIVWFDNAEYADEAMRDFLIRVLSERERADWGDGSNNLLFSQSRILITVGTGKAQPTLPQWCQELMGGDWQHHHDYLSREDEIAMVCRKSTLIASSLDSTFLEALARCAVNFARRTRAAAKYSDSWSGLAWGHGSVLDCMRLLLQRLNRKQLLTEEILEQTVTTVASRFARNESALALLQLAHYEFSVMT